LHLLFYTLPKCISIKLNFNRDQLLPKDVRYPKVVERKQQRGEDKQQMQRSKNQPVYYGKQAKQPTQND